MKFLVSEIKDYYVKQNFDRLNNYLRDNNLITSSFKHFEVPFTAAVVNFKFEHNLGYQPKDVWQTSKTGAGVVTFNFDNFTTQFIDITVTGACVVRFFAGTYKNEGL